MSESSLKGEKLVGIDISKSALKAVCMERRGNLVNAARVALDKDQEFYPQLTGFINQLKTKFGDFEKIGIAMPGLIHQQTKRVAFSTFIPEHEKIDFLQELETATGLSITIENDANASAYGEFLLGAGRGSRNMFYATLGTGIGGALIFDEKIWRGATGFAGEFGQLVINSEGMKLEDVASAENIVRRTRRRFHQDHTSSLNKLEEEQI
ncbi:MAG: ROK family protein, partial [Acidobacteriota bacterium]|nr:ROK family protein [Acidobacteriota bacterium]